MSKINSIFNQVFRPLQAQETAGTEEFAQGTMRKQFIHTLVNHTGDLKMSKAGAASYYQMCRNRLNGKDMYSSHKKWNKSQAKTAPQTVEEINVDLSGRWLVGNKVDKSVFASFTTRTAAQEHNKNLKSQGINSNWMDSQKVNVNELTPALAA